MSVTIKDKLGDIIIENDTFSQIAESAVMECYGVVGLAYKSGGGISRLWNKEQHSKGVEVRVLESGAIALDLYVIIQFGTKISVVAENIIEKVKYVVENQTGIIIDSVNLNIEGVRVRN